MTGPFITDWVYGGTLAGVLLLCLVPLLTRGWTRAQMLTFLLLPVYMIHQGEEHAWDRFRTFFNATIGHGHEVLSSFAVFIINVPGVWGVIAISAWLAVRRDPGFGLIAAYLVLVNGIAHTINGVMLGSYNPGLVSALAVFIPLGTYSVWQIGQATAHKRAAHAGGLTLAIAIHGAIMVYALGHVPA